jgi:death-on-curing protein
MQNWKWIDKQLLMVLHDESLVLHGGAAGVRDDGLLDSALSRPKNLALYGEPDFAELTASYAVGLVKNHAFIDGNKRAAFLSVGLFLGINKYRLVATQVDATLMITGIASSEMAEADFASWIRSNSMLVENIKAM